MTFYGDRTANHPAVENLANADAAISVVADLLDGFAAEHISRAQNVLSVVRRRIEAADPQLVSNRALQEIAGNLGNLVVAANDASAAVQQSGPEAVTAAHVGVHRRLS